MNVPNSLRGEGHTLIKMSLVYSWISGKVRASWERKEHIREFYRHAKDCVGYTEEKVGASWAHFCPMYFVIGSLLQVKHFGREGRVIP